MRLIIAFLGFLPSIYSFAQTGMNSRNNALIGIVVEKDNTTPVEFASVAVIKPESQEILASSMSNEEGEFILDLPVINQKVRLEVTFVGYKTFENVIDLRRVTLPYNLGKIVLEQDLQLLEEVEIVAEQATMNLYVDRKVYNVEKDISARGGTGEDIVKNIPGVELDAEGNPSIRNSSAQIMIDGRPTTLELDKIPADQIEAIEVITNPSAKFDASSSGGIINIRLKKNRKQGYFGTISTGIGTTDRYSTMVNLNANKGIFQAGFNYSFNQVGNNINTYVDRRTFLNGQLNDVFRQDNQFYNSRIFHNLRANLDIQISEKDLLSLSGNYNTGNFGSNEDQIFSLRSGTGNLIQQGEQMQDNIWKFNNYTTQLTYLRKLNKPGKELSFDINYNRSVRDADNSLRTLAFDQAGNIIPGFPLGQSVINNGLTDQVNLQMDYVSPGKNGSRLEAGLRVFYKWSDFENDITREFNQQIFKDSSLSNQFRIIEQIHAAYINYVGKTKWFNYQAGLRFEHTFYEGRILNNETSFSYRYPGNLDQIGRALFPAVYLSRKYNNTNELQLNFSRKIGRPSFWHLNPTININDPRNMRFGNPELRPEFINLAEINHSYTGSKISWLVSIYGRLTEDPITWINFPFDEDPEILVTTSVNGTLDFTYGIENIWKVFFSKKWDISLAANTYMVNVRSFTPLGEFRNTGYTYEIRPNIVYKLPWDMSIQCSGTYRSPRVLPQGQTQSYYFMDISIAKKFGKSWNLALVFSDVFDTKLWGQIFDTPLYFQDATRRREARYARATISYNFGKGERPKQPKRRQSNNDDRRGGEEGDF